MKIRDKRLKMGMLQRDVAAEMGVTRSLVTKWENGMAFPRSCMLKKLAKFLNCTVDELLEE